MALNLDEMRSPPNPNSPEHPSIRLQPVEQQSPPPNIAGYSSPPMNQTTSSFFPQVPQQNVPSQLQSNVAGGSHVDARVENLLNRYTAIISIITVLIILWNVLFIECFCLLRFSCIPDGVETPLFVLKAMGCIFFFTLMLGPGTHYIVRKADKNGALFFKVINIFFIIALIVLFVVSFFLMGGFDEKDIIDKWSQLNAQDRLKYGDSVSNLISENKTNLLLHAIYDIVLSVLFVILTIYLHLYDSVLPQIWLRAAKPKQASPVEDPLIIVPKKKRGPAALRSRIENMVNMEKGRKQNELPVINEERASLLGERSRGPEGPGEGFNNEGMRSPPQGEYRNRGFTGDERQHRQMEGYDPQRYEQSPDRYPRSPQEMALSPERYPRNDLGSPDGGPRNVYTSGYNQPGGPNRFQNIEMVTSNYPGGERNEEGGGARKRQF